MSNQISEGGEGPPGHEGYPVAVLDDGAELSSWTGDAQRRTAGYRAVCACGWVGSVVHPGWEYPDDAARARIMAEWRDHATLIGQQLERVAGLAQLAEVFAGLRREVRAAVARGATVPEVARALAVPEEMAEVLAGHG